MRRLSDEIVPAIDVKIGPFRKKSIHRAFTGAILFFKITLVQRLVQRQMGPFRSI